MRGRTIIVGLLLVALIVAVGPTAWGQRIPRATCLDCHEGEGMRYALVQTTPYIEIPVGELVQLDVTIANPWLHELRDALITVDLSKAPTIGFVTPDALNLTQSVPLTPQANQSRIPFPVLPGATGVVVRMTQPAGPTATPLGAPDIDLALSFPFGPALRSSPDGNDVRPPVQPARVEQMALSGEALASKGTGQWNATVDLKPGSPPTEAELEVFVFYNATSSLSQRFTEDLKAAESGTISFDIRGVSEGPAEIMLTTVVTAYYLHPPNIGQDEGNHTLSQVTALNVTQQLVLGEGPPPLPDKLPLNWKLNSRIWGEATGFVGLFMVPLSLVVGGAFGRRNVLWVNKATGSARLRVLWHNSLSFFLLGFSTIHLLLFLYEEVYDWSVGMVWGGIGSIALIGLAVTGGWQRRFARSLGYANWRLLHIAMAILFVASVLVHVLVDGPHFDIFRAALRLE